MTEQPYRFTTEIPVRWVDIDSVGVLNNAVYMTFLEQARYEYCRELGLLEDAQFPFVLGETTIRYHRPGKAGMGLTVSVRTTRIGGKSFDQSYEVHHGDDLLCSARATLVYVDPEQRSRVVPDRVRAILSGYEGVPERAS